MYLEGSSVCHICDIFNEENVLNAELRKKKLSIFVI